MDPPAIAALSKLVSLFGLSFIAREAGDFLEDGYLSGQQVRLSITECFSDQQIAPAADWCMPLHRTACLILWSFMA